LETRKDLRDARVFSIDPDTARDIDDALSVQLNEDGTYDVGVHIADVSFFVKSNTALDRDARKRATSVYLVQRAVPMLPPMLSEQLCSLLPGQDRLAFSVIFTMDADAKVQKKWYGKTIIRLVLFSIVRFFGLICSFQLCCQASISRRSKGNRRQTFRRYTS
jgi:protein SSD1